MIVELSRFEVAAALAVGDALRDAAIAAGRAAAHGATKDERAAREIHRQGALAEAAVAKALGRFWEVPDFELRGEGDIGAGFHVRSTTIEHGSLILHPEDPDSGIFVLAIAAGDTTWRIVGWIQAADGKRSAFWREDTGRPAFFVPQSFLAPISDLAVAV